MSNSYSLIYDDTLTCPTGDYNFTGGGGLGYIPPPSTAVFDTPAFCAPCLNNVLNSEYCLGRGQHAAACAVLWLPLADALKP